MNSLTPKGRGNLREDKFSSKERNGAKRNRTSSKNKHQESSKTYEYEDMDESEGRIYNKYFEDDQPTHSEKLKMRINLSQEQKFDKGRDYYLSKSKTGKLANRKSLLRAAQEHYAKRTSSRKKVQMSPSLKQSSKIS
jgi:hypothetical protein